MLWICLTAWAGLFIWYFRMRKKAEDHKLVRRIFCLAATGFIAGTALCLPIGVRKVSGDEKAELHLIKLFFLLFTFQCLLFELLFKFFLPISF